MSEIKVADLAERLKAPLDSFMKQLESAGISVSGPDDILTEDQQAALLKATASGASAEPAAGSKLSLRRGGATTSKTSTGVEVKRKRTLSLNKAAPAPSQEELEEQARQEELAKQAEAERLEREKLIAKAEAERRELEAQRLTNQPEPDAPSNEEVSDTTDESVDAAAVQVEDADSTVEPDAADSNPEVSDGQRQRNEVVNKAKEEAASALKRRPSRVKKAEPEAPASEQVPEPPPSEKPSSGRKKPVKRKLRNRLAEDDGFGRGKRQVRKQVVIEREVKHGFEKPVAPVTHEIEVPANILVGDLAQKLAVRGSDVIKVLMGMGMMTTINQTIDQDTAILVTEELGHVASPQAEVDDESILAEVLETSEDFEKEIRPPVVTIMGHVDHGKTSLLDYIRKSRVASGEAGGITQHIGAYHVKTDEGTITFLDTPGHAAFTKMRARGTEVTDIVILIVAADDSVMPQTKEAIEHVKAAGVPMIVAINKIDKEGADPERVLSDLSSNEVVTEEWGGDVPVVKVSAETGQGVSELLETILLVAEVQELTAPVDSPAKGAVIEASVERGRGAVATVLVKEGTLKKGDLLLCGTEYGRVRALIDESGQQVKTAGPSIPVAVLGLSSAPAAGDEAFVVRDERKAREIANMRKEKLRDTRFAEQNSAKLENLFNQMGTAEQQQVNLLVKADVQGSVEAIRSELAKLSTEEVAVRILSSGVGGLNESDIDLAAASKAIVVAFNVRADATARKSAGDHDVEIRYYSVIYDVINDVKDAMSGLLSPETKEEFIGLAEVKAVFRASGFGQVAGCLVVEGAVKKGNPIRVLRDNVVIFEGELESLRRHKDDVGEVSNGTECGIAVKDYEVEVGDQIECFEHIEVARTI